MTTIGFIGLGHMGNPMVRNLLKANFKVKIFDVVPAAMQALTADGATLTHSISEVVKDSDVIFTMLQTSEQVSDACLNPNGIFVHAKKDMLYIDSSSIDITVTQKLHEEAKARGIAMLDAPVSGGVAGASAATLTFMVGGDEKNFERAKSILEKLGKKIVYTGAAGSGGAAKICNNLLLAISMIGVCEAFSLAEKLKLDPKKFFEISSNASGQCWSLTSYCPYPNILPSVPSSHNYEPGFMAKMMLKDLRLAEDAAESVDALIPLGEAATELYEIFVNEGFGEKDFSGIMEWVANKHR